MNNIIIINIQNKKIKNKNQLNCNIIYNYYYLESKKYNIFVWL